MLGSWACSADMLFVFLSSLATGGQAGIPQLPATSEGKHWNNEKAINVCTARYVVALLFPVAFSASVPLTTCFASWVFLYQLLFIFT